MRIVLFALVLISVVVVSGCTVANPSNSNKSADKNITGTATRCYGLNESQCESNKECRPTLDPVCGFAGDCHYLYGGCQSV
ncbi:MAG TPA: hypothetical protein VJA47_05510, partial [archaeon]|nr:hypothetical protein [archaeon]